MRGREKFTTLVIVKSKRYFIIPNGYNNNKPVYINNLENIRLILLLEPHSG